jgi:hypothetical protein
MEKIEFSQNGSFPFATRLAKVSIESILEIDKNFLDSTSSHFQTAALYSKVHYSTVQYSTVHIYTFTCFIALNFQNILGQLFFINPSFDNPVVQKCSFQYTKSTRDTHKWRKLNFQRMAAFLLQLD